MNNPNYYNQNQNQNKRSSYRRRGGRQRYENYNENKNNNSKTENINTETLNNNESKGEFDLEDFNFNLYPVNYVKKMNMDFSAFPLLLEETYREIGLHQHDLNDLMPFCVYQHAMFNLLNKIVINKPTYCYSYLQRIPKPIKYYIDQIHNKKSSNGYEIYYNLPESAIPQGPIRNDNNEIFIPAGSFGPITAENHNLYECYASPFISKRLIEHTIYANEKNDFKPWNPLPSGAYPEDAICTSNFIGYRIPEKLTSEGMKILKKIKFQENTNDKENTNKKEEIFCYSHEVEEIVRSCLFNIDHKFPLESTNSEKGFVLRGSKIGMIGYLEVISKNVLDYNERLIVQDANLYSHEKLKDFEVKKSIITGLRRRRNIKAPGYCMVKSDGKPIEGWENTINDNFESKDNTKSTEFLQEKRFCWKEVSPKRSMEDWIKMHYQN